MIFDVTVNGRDYRVELDQKGNGSWVARVNGEQVTVNSASTASGALSLLIAGESSAHWIRLDRDLRTVFGLALNEGDC